MFNPNDYATCKDLKIIGSGDERAMGDAEACELEGKPIAVTDAKLTILQTMQAIACAINRMEANLDYHGFSEADIRAAREYAIAEARKWSEAKDAE